MKKVICLSIVLLFIFAFTGCGKQTTDNSNKNEQIVSFSWSETKEYYFKDTLGVKTSGFKNTSEKTINNNTDAISCAKSEVTVEYDTIGVSFDKNEEIWGVSFSKENTLGGDQTVYLNSKGITQLIVYGE